MKLTFYQQIICVLTGVYPQPQPPPEAHTQFFIPVSNQNIRGTMSSSFLGLTAVWLLGSSRPLPTPSKAAPLPICGS